MNHQQISLESEAGFQVLFRCATIGILVISESGKVELSNPCAEALFGYYPDELIGKKIEVLLPENLRDRHRQHRENYFANPKARPMGLGMELYARKKSGEVFPVEISLGHYELGGERLAVAFVTDITNQVEAKKIIAQREEWFRNMADNSPVMIWSAGNDMRRNYFNNTWLEFTGRTLEQEIGNGWIEGVHPDDAESVLAIYGSALDSRQPFTMEYRLRRYDGVYRWIRAVGKPAYSPENIFTGYIGSCSDIHDQKLMHEELESLVMERTNELYRALDREKEMNELKSRFVSMASHEFRTPLSVVLSSTILIGKYLGEATSEKVNQHLHKIKSSVTNLTSILNDFLSLDKLEQGNVGLEIEQFNITPFMSDIISDVSLLEKKGQQIKLVHNGEGEVELDQKKLRYVMFNLMSNAIKYSPENTDIKLSSTCRDGRIVIKVEDRGIGIPEDEQKHMFTKFFRARNTGNAQGTGLGLTIVKRYVELMGGDVTFKSKDGEGTTFTIDLPRVFSGKTKF